MAHRRDGEGRGLARERARAAWTLRRPAKHSASARLPRAPGSPGAQRRNPAHRYRAHTGRRHHDSPRHPRHHPSEDDHRRGTLRNRARADPDGPPRRPHHAGPARRARQAKRRTRRRTREANNQGSHRRVKYDTAEAFRAALDQRIRNEATTTSLPVMRLRKRVAFERFLARLAITEPGNWVLKGAFALELRLGVRTRATKDIALAGADDEQTATTRLIAAQAINLHDHFNFDVARTAALDQAEAFRAVRYSITAEVAGRRFEQFPVDVALNEQPTAPSERLLI